MKFILKKKQQEGSDSHTSAVKGNNKPNIIEHILNSGTSSTFPSLSNRIRLNSTHPEINANNKKKLVIAQIAHTKSSVHILNLRHPSHTYGNPHTQKQSIKQLVKTNNIEEAETSNIEEAEIK